MRLFYHVFFVLNRTRSWKKLLQASEVNESIQSLLRKNSLTVLAFSEFIYNHTILILLKANTVNWYPFLLSPHTSQYPKIFHEKIVTELQHSQLSVLQNEEA